MDADGNYGDYKVNFYKKGMVPGVLETASGVGILSFSPGVQEAKIICSPICKTKQIQYADNGTYSIVPAVSGKAFYILGVLFVLRLAATDTGDSVDLYATVAQTDYSPGTTSIIAQANVVPSVAGVVNMYVPLSILTKDNTAIKYQFNNGSFNTNSRIVIYYVELEST